MFDWNHIRSFIAVADAGTLSGAAQATGISQPTLGRHIGDLEAATGLTLFSRGRSGMALTQAGLTMIDEARAMAAEAERFALKAAGRAASVSGPVRITASDIVATYMLPPVLTALREAEPDIEVELVASNAVQNLLSRDADIAVRMVRPTQGDLIARKVQDMTLGAFAHRRYLERYGRPGSYADFVGHRLIGYDRDDLIVRSMAAMGLPARRSDFAIRTDDQVAYWELVRAGGGIGFGARYLGSLSPDLEELAPDLEIPPLPMWLAAHQELRTSLKIRRVMDFVFARLAELPLSVGFSGAA